MSDTFRKHYNTLAEEKTAHILLCKEKAEELESLMKKYSSREMSLALTNLEQALMWCTKAIVINGE